MSKIILLTLIISSFIMPQSKYFIYFKDKGAAGLGKNSAEYSQALSMLSEKAIERRKSVLGENNIITYEDLPVNNEYIQKIKEAGVKTERELSWFNSVSAYLTNSQLEQIKQFPFVEKIELVKTISFRRTLPVTLEELPSAPAKADELNYGQSFTQLNLSGIPEVHAAGITGEGVLVGFLDSGFDWKRHESLTNAKVLGEYDFIFNDSVTANQAGDSGTQDNHGTKVFSVVGGFKQGSLIGAAYNASFLLAKTEYVPTETKVEEDNYAAALIWMEQKGVDITSSSLGYNEFDDGSYAYSDMNGKTAVTTKALEHAFELGVITITAAGNEGSNSWYYITAPADGFNVIAVGAVNSSNVVASFSSHGPAYDGRIKPEVTAQGVNVYGATAGTASGYAPSGGTSLATPIVCGVAALLKSAYPYLTNTQVRNILIETADSAASPNNERGYGLVSAARAVSYPNIFRADSGYFLNKMFIGDKYTGMSSVQVYFSQDGQTYSSYNIDAGQLNQYSTLIPETRIGSILDIYYTYSNGSGNTIREPQSGTFKVIYGTLNVSYNLTTESMFPNGFELLNNYPNPFNSVTTILYKLPESTNIKLTIYNVLGEKISTLVNSFQEAGIYRVSWNAGNFASGMYIYVLESNTKILSGKMMLLK
jgi:serine protease AprX